MLREVIDALAVRAGGVYVDGTFGHGGYARAILEAAPCRLIGIDRDPHVVAAAREAMQGYTDRFSIVEAPFATLDDVVGQAGLDGIDGFDLDLGVSSMQLDDGARGFSFRHDGPLSMRMDAGKPDAADLVRMADAHDLRQIMKVYGEERHAGRIARAIIAAREAAPITTTGRLAAIIAGAVPPSPRPQRIHPATRAFQAFRIFVNDELGQLVRALLAAEAVLKPAGRLVVVTFHSLEDRIVKRFLAARSGRAGGGGSRHAPPDSHGAPATFDLLYGKPVEPGADEIDRNPRARSARLRAAIRTEAPSRDDVPGDILPRLTLSDSLSQWSNALS